MSGERGLDPALDRVLRIARDRRERRGGAGDATVSVRSLSDEEAFALDGLIAAVAPRRRAVRAGATVRLRLSELEAALGAAGLDPRTEYERVGGGQLRDRPAERASVRHARQELREWLLGHPVLRARPRAAAWADRALRQGRLHPGLRPVVEQALAVLDALPAAGAAPTQGTAPAAGAAPVQRTVLAARVCNGDPHALDPGTPLHGLLAAMLRAESGLEDEIETGVTPRQVWARFGVLVDPASSNVLALGVPLLGDGAAARVACAAAPGHVVLTYAQLTAGELGWPAGTPCFSCENPSVLIAAEAALGPRCAPLVCTGGYPSDAARLLLSLVARAGGEIRHHGDFDPAGVAIFEDLRAHCAAVPWRFGVSDLRRAAQRRKLRREPGRAQSGQKDGIEVGGLQAEDDAIEIGGLADAVGRLSHPIPEELLLEELLSDLAADAPARRADLRRADHPRADHPVGGRTACKHDAGCPDHRGPQLSSPAPRAAPAARRLAPPGAAEPQ